MCSLQPSPGSWPDSSRTLTNVDGWDPTVTHCFKSGLDQWLLFLVPRVPTKGPQVCFSERFAWSMRAVYYPGLDCNENRGKTPQLWPHHNERWWKNTHKPSPGSQPSADVLPWIFFKQVTPHNKHSLGSYTKNAPDYVCPECAVGRLRGQAQHCGPSTHPLLAPSCWDTKPAWPEHSTDYKRTCVHVKEDVVERGGGEAVCGTSPLFFSKASVCL